MTPRRCSESGLACVKRTADCVVNLYYALLGLAGNRDVAREAVAEAFTRAWPRLDPISRAVDLEVAFRVRATS